MPFESILGQEPAVETLRRAMASGRVHHAYRFEGPPGVGKELTAIALAVELIGGPQASDICRHRITTFSDEEPRVPLHPDLVFIGRGIYGKLLDATEASGISVEQIRRVVLSRIGYPPHEGESLVFIIRDADELTPQAANALLKTLEEPSPRTHFILLTSRPKRLLDTLLSRTLAVRFGPLPDAVVAELLERQGKPKEVASFAQGSMELALALADPESVAEREQFAIAVKQALAATDLVPALLLAEAHSGERGPLRGHLVHLAQTLARDGRAWLAQNPEAAERAARHHQCVLAAMEDLERNGQPALVLESMIYRMRGS